MRQSHFCHPEFVEETLDPVIAASEVLLAMTERKAFTGMTEKTIYFI